MHDLIQTLSCQVDNLEESNQNICQDNNDLEQELTMKQGQIEYLENRNSGNNPLGRNNNKQRAKLEDPDKFTSEKDDKGNYLTEKG